ncbi:hypothetical protein IVB11_27590 [Bradyrhizobium sp. 177]|uniref:hypothetical protein n=1 Tax=Bradyrhizobium sp. 177 TaxID=2782647 RepID=UPI001FF99326|nr:hypothetical protein [Bradyrhizobium sp. 177]MCK1552703.1 hypothetical protein [Bradyrhizobium sp. 177]
MARHRPTQNPYTWPTIFTVERLHAELGGQILENRQQGEQLRDQMRHVEAVLKLLDPGHNLARIAVKRRKANPWFKRGSLYRRAVDVLRTATEAMTASEIAAAVLAAHGVQDSSKEDVQGVALGIQHSLKNHEGKGDADCRRGKAGAVAACWLEPNLMGSADLRP